MTSPVQVRVMFCCRNANGDALCSATALRIDTGDGHSLSADGRDIVLREFFKPGSHHAGLVQFGRQRVIFTRWETCVGNVHWDRLTLPFAAARKVLAYAVKMGWQVTDATCDGPFADIIEPAKP